MVSPTELVRQIQQGDERAVQTLWEQYRRYILTIARDKLGNLPRRELDSEDIAQMAFQGFVEFCVRYQDKRVNRGSIKALLATITRCRAYDVRRRNRKERRIRGESGFPTCVTEDTGVASRGIEQVVDVAQVVDEELIAIETYHQLLLQVDPDVQDIVRLHLAGSRNKDIARELKTSNASVSRKLTLFKTMAKERLDNLNA